MTNILLIIIAVLLGVRIVLQVRQGKRAFDKMYCAPSEVENIEIVVGTYHVSSTLREYGKCGYEFVQAVCPYGGRGSNATQLFFTRKKIKNFWEE